jgi:glutamate-1-semialdehyde 2,1-aminomutase
MEGGRGLMENFIKRYKLSGEHVERAKNWTPTGAQTISKAPERFPVGAYPIYLDRGDGAYVWDVDGNKYLDMICGLASMTLGYGRERISGAIAAQMQKGISFSLSTKLESQLAERLCGIFPCGHEGAVRFVKTGSEAAEGAVRIARRATGRDVVVVVKSGYHSWHSAFSAVKDVHPGCPQALESLIRGFTYNDLLSLERVLDASVAAVMLEPTLNEKPDSGFLEGVKRLAHQTGALLIFDEVVCAGRWARAGGQEYFNITPDLATAGKSLANGMPLGCIIGPRNLMAYADVVSGTFGGETLSLAACMAVQDIYDSEPIVEKLWANGRQFQDAFNMHAVALNAPAICDGFAVKPRIRFTTPDALINNLPMSLFVQEMARCGVLWHPAGGNISAAMESGDINMAVHACAESLALVQKALRDNDWSALKGKRIQPSRFVRGVS